MSTKVHPGALLLSSHDHPSSSSSCSSDKQEVFTIWMKSLIFGGKGCTVFDSKGDVVYRVDNYNSKSTSKVFLMDSSGKLLCTIIRKNWKLKLCTQWVGYRPATPNQAWFRVRKPWKQLFSTSSNTCLQVSLITAADGVQRRPLRIESSSDKCKGSSSSSSACKMMDSRAGGGRVVAEVKRKEAVGGIVLGSDVSTLTVEANLDHQLIMGLLVSYGLISSII